MVGKRNYIPRQGDIVWLNFSPQAGHEQAGKRPALIISPSEYNRKAGLAVCCPITNQAKGYPFEVRIPANLPITGVILSDHLKSLDWRARSAEHVCRIQQVTFEEVLGKVGALLSNLDEF